MIYVDANPFIYAIEGEDALAEPANELFAAIRRTPPIAVTSELTLAEVLPKASDDATRKRYMDLIVWSGISHVRPVRREILLETADYRRATATMVQGSAVVPKLPDAIHAVTAIHDNCNSIVSSYTRLKLPATMQAVSADAYGIRALLQSVRQ
jgi:predicted nucleic acid-binding protein